MSTTDAFLSVVLTIHHLPEMTLDGAEDGAQIGKQGWGPRAFRRWMRFATFEVQGASFSGRAPALSLLGVAAVLSVIGWRKAAYASRA